MGRFLNRRGPLGALSFCVGCLALAAVFGLPLAGCETSGSSLGKDVLARLGKDQINVEEYMAAVYDTPPARFEDRKEVLMRLINNRLVANRAHKEGILVGPETMSELTSVEIERLPNLLSKQIYDSTELSDEELEPYRKGVIIPKLEVTMLVALTQEYAEATLKELQSGKTFQEVADEHPEYFGEVKVIEREVSLTDDKYPAGVRAALNRLAEGELSPIMKLQVGYGIFRLDKRVDPDEAWESSKADIREQVRVEKAGREYKALGDMLYSEADISMEEVPGGYHATVNGTSISHEGIMSTESSGDPHAPHAGMNRQTVKDALNNAIRKYLLAEEAKRRGLDKDPQYQMVMKLETEKILADQYIDKITEGVTVTEQDVLDYYEKNKDNFASSELARVSRILLDDEKKADRIAEMLGSGGDFADLARKYSADEESGPRGGDVGWVKVSKLKEPLKDLLYGLELGRPSDVVKSDYGFELLMVTERKPSVVPELSSIRDTVVKRVALTKRSEVVESIFKKLYEENDVKLNEELLRSL